MKGRLSATVAKWGAAVLFVAVPARAVADTVYWPPPGALAAGCSDRKEGENCSTVVRMTLVDGRCVKRVGTVAGQEQPVEKLECVPLSRLQDKARPGSAKGKPTHPPLGEIGTPRKPQASPARGKPQTAPAQGKPRAAPVQDRPAAPVQGKPAAAPVQQRPQAPPAEQAPGVPPAQSTPAAAEHARPAAQTEPNGCSVGAGPGSTPWVAGLLLLLVGLGRSASQRRGEK